jgi:hypothetical protein
VMQLMGTRIPLCSTNTRTQRTRRKTALAGPTLSVADKDKTMLNGHSVHGVCVCCSFSAAAPCLEIYYHATALLRYA